MTILSIPLVLMALSASAAVSSDDCINHGNTPKACELLESETTAAERALNSTYRSLTAKLASASTGGNMHFAEARSSLVEAQRAWITFRRNDCDARAANYSGLNLLSGIGNTCMRDRARQRTIELQEMLDDLAAIDPPK